MKPTDSGGRVLDPIERVSEILFGLIMVLSFTGSISVAESGREEIRTVLVGAIGCNTAWGLVDAVMYVLSNLIERGRRLSTLRAIRGVGDPEKAREILARELPPGLVSVLRRSDLEHLQRQVELLPPPPLRARLTRADFRGALGVFLLVFLSTFPVVVPFLVFREPRRALRVSNGVAIGMLFFAGWALGRYAGQRPLWMGLSMVGIGILLVGATLALGG